MRQGGWERVKRVGVLNCSRADVGLPAVPEPLMGVKEVRNMVQLVLCILDEPYSKLTLFLASDWSPQLISDSVAANSAVK